MTAVLIFSGLLLAVLLSGLARRSILSTAVLFLAAGFVTGPGVLGWIPLSARDGLVTGFVELAMVSVLFTEGTQVEPSRLASSWRLPARALGLGLPLTLLLTALLGRVLIGLPWPHARLLGAVLSPTDPVLASALLGREEVPGRLRQLLNVESGLNDGLALPAVVVLLAVASGSETHPGRVLLEVAGGVLLGAGLPPRGRRGRRLGHRPFLHRCRRRALVWPSGKSWPARPPAARTVGPGRTCGSVRPELAAARAQVLGQAGGRAVQPDALRGVPRRCPRPWPSNRFGRVATRS
jgi:NhaP-type Na+/H+ or K+/H+ antiporter